MWASPPTHHMEVRAKRRMIEKPPSRALGGGFCAISDGIVGKSEADRDGRVDLIHDALVRVSHMLTQAALIDGPDLL